MKTPAVTGSNENMAGSAYAHEAMARGASRTKRILIGLALTVAVVAPNWASAAGPATVNLGTAGHFAILAGTAISDASNVGTVNGDVGLSPATGANITGLTSVKVNGVIYAVDAAGPAGSLMAPAMLTVAVNDLTAAYNDADTRPAPDVTYAAPGQIGGLTLVPGLYKFTSTALITTGNLTLFGGPNDVWIFQIKTGLTVGPNIDIILSGGAQAKNIFWQVGSAAILGTATDFKGTIMAGTSITLPTTSTVEGRALAFAKVTFDGTSVSLPADYDLTKTVVSPAGGAAQVGDTLVFQITVANTGDVTLVTVPLVDTYDPAILQYVSADPTPSSTTPAGTLTWANVGPLAPWASTNIFVSFLAVGSTAGLWKTNTVVASPTVLGPAYVPVKTNTAPYSTDNTSTSDSGYVLGKTVVSPLGRPAQVGETIVFSITVVNTGTVAIAPLPIQDQYSTTYLSFAWASPGEDNPADDGTLDWTNIGPLAPGATTNIFVAFTVVDSTAGQLATNVVVASPPNMPWKTNEVTYSTSRPGYSVTKTVSSPVGGAALVGQTVIFQITVVNTGDVTLAIVPIEDQYSPSALLFVGATLPPVSPVNDGTLNWTNVGPLAVGETTNITVTFTAVGSTAGIWATNLVVVAPFGVPAHTNAALYRVSFGPTPVVLKSFSAAYEGQSVLVQWETGAEIDNLGFNVYRATDVDGPRTKVNNALIPGMGNSSGQHYDLRDAVPDATVAYWYWLEDVSWSFETETHGPVMAAKPQAASIGSFTAGAGGLYRISWDAMKTAKLPVREMPLTEIQIRIAGQEVAAHVHSDNGILDKGDYILCYVPYAGGPQTCDISLRKNALRMELVYAKPLSQKGDVRYEIAGPDQEMLFEASPSYVRYLLTDFVKTPVWVLDVTDPILPKLLYGYSYLRLSKRAAVYMSYPGLGPEPAICTAIGDGAVEVPTIRRTPDPKSVPVKAQGNR